MSETRAANVYKIRHWERGEWLRPVNTEEHRLLTFDGKPRARSWKPVVMKRLKDFGDGRPVQSVDFPCGSGGGDLPMTDAAREKIRPYLEKYGEFLPLSCDEGKFWTFHVTHFVDALDENASDVLRSPDDPKVVLMILKHVFRPERLTTDWMFKLPQSRGRGPFYVTDPFVDLIRDSGLTGLEFKRVWPHS
jgi:hypothetical protein